MKYLLYVISLFSFIASIVIIPNPVGILSVLLLFTTLYNVEIKKIIYKKVYYILLLYSIAYCYIGIAVNRIDHVNYLNNGLSLCLYILGVIIIDIIYSRHFKRKKKYDRWLTNDIILKINKDKLYLYVPKIYERYFYNN